MPAKQDPSARLVAPLKWRKAAAAAAALLVGGLVWHGVSRVSGLHPVPSGLRPPISVSPVRVVRQWGSSGLELPAALPGALRLGNGRAVVRLESGVELTLLGPLEAEVRDAMQVRLESGRLLAEVPHWATGFIVRAPGLDIYDLGTVFGVSADGRNSGVFVFKGSVQVNEATGEAVGLCEAGGGVRAAAGRRPLQMAADWPEAQKVFAVVRGTAALADPSGAFDAADRIAALWTRRYMPTVVPPPPPPVAGLRGKAIGKGQSAPAISNHTTTAARKAAPFQNEEDAMRMTNTVAALATAVTMGAGAAWAVPEVSNVQMTQRAGSRVVDITYDLAGEAAIVTLGIETNGVPIPDSAVTRLSGDVSAVIQPGAGRHIVWNAGADWPENVTESAKARVTAWSVDAPPQVMVIDLSGGTAATTYPVFYYSSMDALPYGGVTNSLYKADYLVMRKIPSVGFNMGEYPTTTAVTLSQDFYTGVFEVTQEQWYNVMGVTRAANFTDVASRAFRPMEMVSYEDIRGTAAQGGAGWPADDSVYAESFVGLLRTKAGLSGFDLPTEAQWEYACRAGTDTCFNDDAAAANVTGANAITNAWLNALGRYRFDGGYIDGVTAPAVGCGPANGTAIVGSYLPNAWGLYDTHGNVWEWCLDWYGTLEGGENPDGADSGPNRVKRGGSWNDTAADSRSAYRSTNVPSGRYNRIGFRLVRTLP